MRILAYCLLALFALPSVAVEEITALGLFADKAMLRIDGKQRMLRVGELSPEGVKLVAADSEQATIEFNGQQRKITLGSHISSRFTAAKTKKVQIWPDSNGMYSVGGSVNGKSIGFLVDTGANVIALNAVDAKRLGLDYKASGKKSIAETASGVSEAYLVKLNSVSVGSIKLYDVDAIVLEGSHPRTALLGLTFLNRVNMQRDGDLMTLEKK